MGEQSTYSYPLSLGSLKPERATEVDLETGEMSHQGLGQHHRTVCGQVLVTTGLQPAKRALNSVFYSDPRVTGHAQLG